MLPGIAVNFEPQCLMQEPAMDSSVEMMKQIVENVEKVIVGKRRAIELALVSLACNGHVLIEDVPGVGKTSLVSSLAKSIDATFKRIQFTPDILPSDITGFSIYNQKNGEFEYRAGGVMSNIILADEINRTSPKTQASLLEVMEENQVTVDGVTYKVPQPFMVLATQNPLEYLGTYPLPEAQIDRFFMKITIGYPDAEEESTMLRRFAHGSPVAGLQPVARGEDILSLQGKIENVHVDRSLQDYIVNIVRESRKHVEIALGASPRGSLSLLKASRAWAFYQGRNHVRPEDIQFMAIPVLAHRLVLKQEARLKRISSLEIMEDILHTVHVPILTRGYEGDPS